MRKRDKDVMLVAFFSFIYVCMFIWCDLKIEERVPGLYGEKPSDYKYLSYKNQEAGNVQN